MDGADDTDDIDGTDRTDDTDRGSGPELWNVDGEGRDAMAVVEAHASLLEDTPHVDEVPEELHGSVEELLDLVTSAYALPVLYRLVCAQEPLRFGEIEASTGASPKVLSERLSEFVEAGLLDCRSYDEIPPRVEYEPTANVRALEPAFQFLYAWATHYDLS